MERLRPFFSYFGSKWRLAPYYPPPHHEVLIEPFAGSACYALLYPQKKVKLFDTNPRIVSVWQYLIRASEAEILSLPEQLDWDGPLPPEAKFLIGFHLAQAATEPFRKKKTSWHKTRPKSFWGPERKARIASQQKHIRHWRCVLSDFSAIPNQEATWFVDPPYQGPEGRAYTFNKICYSSLSEFCRSRLGQVIACDSERADWLPFQPFQRTRNVRNRNFQEGIWLK